MKKILILGNSAKEYALAKKLSDTCEVYVAPGSDLMSSFANVIDIRDNSVSEVLEYAMENGIDMTIPCSLSSLQTNITELFEKNGQNIFAPSQNAINILADKASAKKLLYKLRISTPRFGIFEKQNMVVDYIKNLRHPFVIKTNEPSSAVVLSDLKFSKGVLDSIFMKNAHKVVIEDYVAGTPFVFYTITDGYKALPIGSSIIYKHSLDGDGGQLTSGMGACVPNYKLSLENEAMLMESVVYPTLDYLNAQNCQYVGILGVNGIIEKDGQLQILGYQTFLQDADADSILEMIDTDIYSLIESCTLGSFSDEVEYIPQKNMSAVSLVLNCTNKDNSNNYVTGLDNIDEDVKISFYGNIRKNKYLEPEVEYGPVAVLTAYGRSISSASEKVYNEAESVVFNGKRYRNDICKTFVSAI